MRYWVYKDSRILGPVSSEEISHIEGSGPDLLLCPEGADAGRENDWRTAGEIPELAALFPAGARTAVSAIEPPEAAEYGLWTSEPPYEESEGRLGSRRAPWEGEPSFRQKEEQEAQRRRSEEQQAKLAELEGKLAGYERQQGEILDRLAEKDRLLDSREKEIQKLRQELEQTRSAEIESREKEIRELRQQLEQARLAAQQPAAAEQEAPRRPPAPAEEPAAPAIISLSVQEPAAKAEAEPRPGEETGFRLLDIPPAVSLPLAAQEPLSASPFSPPTPAPADVEPAALSSAPPVPAPPVTLEFFPSEAPEPSQAPLSPEEGPTSGPIPSVLEPPSAGLAALASSTAPMPEWPGGPSGYTPPPIELQSPDPFSLPRTMIGSPSAPAAAKAPGMPLNPPQPGAAPAKPDEPAPAPLAASTAPSEPKAAASDAKAQPKRGRWRMPLVVAGALLAVAAGSLFLIKGAKAPAPGAQTAEEPVPGGSPAPLGQLSPSQPAPGSSRPPSSFGRPQASPSPAQTAGIPVAAPAPPPNRPPEAAPAPSASTAGSAPAASPEAAPASAVPEPSAAAPGRDFIADRSQDAIALVKGYPLERDRGSVAAWLQYSYLAPGSREKWTANPGESPGAYFVQYEVSRQGTSAREIEPTVYLFRADVDLKTVQGFNKAAKELLTGSPRKTIVRKRAPSPKPKAKPRKHRALKPGEVPLLPLPSDSELRRP